MSEDKYSKGEDKYSMSNNEENGIQKLPNELLAKIFDMRAEALFHYYKDDLGVMFARFYAHQELFQALSLEQEPARKMAVAYVSYTVVPPEPCLLHGRGMTDPSVYRAVI